MRLLAVEASTQLPSCALYLDGEIVERVCDGTLNSSETLLPAITALLAEYRLRVSDLDGIAFGAGPGSFTGLRVAAGITQGLAFAADLRVAPIETLAAVAWASTADSGESFTVAALDARMSEIYLGAYQRKDGRLIRLGELQVGPPDRLPLPDIAAPRSVCGNAAAAYPVFAARLAGWTVAPASVPMAGAIAELGSHVFLDGKALVAELAQPIYVRDKVAFTTAERLARGGKS